MVIISGLETSNIVTGLILHFRDKAEVLIEVILDEEGAIFRQLNSLVSISSYKYILFMTFFYSEKYDYSYKCK